MKHVAAERVRNFGLAGHSGSGKTLLADTMLFKAGAVTRIGKVEEKSSVSDFRKEEQEHGQSLYATPMHCDWKNHQLFILDTPGNPDFVGETTAALHCCDVGIVVIDAAAGIEFGTQRALRIARKLGTPRAVFINAMDKDNANFEGILSELQERYGETVCVPFTLPHGSGSSFEEVYHVLRTQNPPADIADRLAHLPQQYHGHGGGVGRGADDALSGGRGAERGGDRHGASPGDPEQRYNPGLLRSAAQDIGVEELMTGIVNLFPSPLDRGTVHLKDGGDYKVSEDGPAEAFVFKSVIDPYIGQLTYLRLYSGRLKAGDELFNITRGTRERMTGLMLTNGKEQEPVDEVVPGAIFAVPKLKDTHINDTLSTKESATVQMEPTIYPTPSASYAIYATKKGEEDKIIAGLQQFAEEDPTLKIERNDETHELVVSGLGDLHIHIIVERLRDSAKVEVELRQPKIAYRETVTKIGTGQHRHKKQSGGHGQFAEVQMRVEPAENGTDYEFANEVTGGNIPRNYIPGVEKGVQSAMDRGPLAHCKVINLRAVVTDGKHHPVDSSDMAFQIAGRAAIRQAIQDANPILLEPIMHLEVTAPDSYTGDITGDISQRRGRLHGMMIEENLQVIEAEVPQSEMHGYSSQLRSITHGRGSFDMNFVRYEQVPSNIAKQIQDAVVHEEEEDE